MTEESNTNGVADVPGASSRRNLLVLGGAATVAALAGAGLAWWRKQGADPALPPAEPVPGFWGMQWDTLQGQKLAMQTFRGMPLLLNFWATWCPPCVQELPMLNAFYRAQHQHGWQVLGLAVDNLAAVQGFLQHAPLDFPVALAGAAGTELARALGDAAGSLPFSVAFGADGQVVQRKLGRLHPDDLDQWLALK